MRGLGYDRTVRRMVQLLVVAGLLAAWLTVAGSALAQGPRDCPGIYYDQPAGGHVEIRPSDYVAVDHAIAVWPSTEGGDVVAGSESIVVDGPGGQVSIPANTTDRNAAPTTWTPQAVGHYTLTAKWRMYRCQAAGHETYEDFQTAPLGVDVRPQKHATTRFKITRRKGVTNAPGFSAIVAFILCPGRNYDSPEPWSLDIYYELGSRPPSHASRAVHTTAAKGCQTRSPRSTRAVHTKNFDINEATVRAEHGARLRILYEVKLAGHVIATRSVRFTPSAHGERAIIE